MYQVLYVVRTTSLTLDSRLVVGLSSTQVREALDTNVHAVLNTKYSNLLVASLTDVFLYASRFTLDFTFELGIFDLDDFTDAIKQQFVTSGIFAAVADIDVIVVTQEEVIDANGNSFFQLVFFVRDVTSMLVIDSRVTTVITRATWAPIVQALGLTNPQGLAYAIAADLEVPVVRLSVCHSLLVRGRVLISQENDFTDALQIAVRASDVMLATARVQIVAFLEVVIDNQFATSVTYTVSVDDMLYSPYMLLSVRAANVTLGALTNVMGEAYELLDPTSVTSSGGVLRYRFSSAVYLREAVLMSDVEELRANLEREWRDHLISVSDLSIVFGLQEEIVLESG